LHFDSNGVCNHVEMKVTRKLRQTPRPGNWPCGNWCFGSIRWSGAT